MSVQTIGDLNMYDPNKNIGGSEYTSYGFGTNPDNNNAVNQEDLIMYCNLRAFTRPRSYIMTSNGDGVKTQAVASGRINFLKPNKDKDKFTTDWTELDASGKPNGEEMLGINSVQITYDTSYVPRVTITMTDVRGQALNEDPKDSPYGAFFNFPYPMFVLEVKGYYGKAVKYLLHLLKYSSRFDYSTGNFQITCEFVGFTYALLSDLNVQYGLVASQMEINGKSGKDRLKKKFELQAEKYKKDDPKFSTDIDNIVNSKGEFYTLVNLIVKSKELGTFVESLNTKSDLFLEKGLLDNFIDVITSLYSDVVKGEILNESFNIAVSKINGDSLFTNYPDYKSQLECRVKSTDAPVDKISDKTIKDYTNYYETSKNYISRRNTEIQKKLNEEVKSELTNFLGFTPTIRNIMLIICNNFELFLDLLTETTQRAGEKRVDKFNKQLNQNPKVGRNLELIYPWPALFNETDYEVCYFDDIPTLITSDYPEKEFVEAFLDATQYTNKLLAFTGGTTVSSEITDPVLFNPIHTQQYNVDNLKTPIFSENPTECLAQIIEHALLISSNSWGGKDVKQVKNFGKVDADNLYKSLGNTGIGHILPILTKNLNWINDSVDNNKNNQPLGILQIISNNKNIIKDDNKKIDNDVKQKFQYIKDFGSDYLTDIVENEDISNLIDKYSFLGHLRFVPEVKNNLLGVGDYGTDSVTTENNGFIYYEKNNKFQFPEEISLSPMFQPFMEKRILNETSGGYVMVYNNELLTTDNLLISLKSVLIDLQRDESLNFGFWDYVFNLGLLGLFEKGFKVESILEKTPGILDNKKDFVLFNGIHKTKMACALNYLFFNDDNFLNPPNIGDYRYLNKYKYYFPFTTNQYPNSDIDNPRTYSTNRNKFLDVYKQLIEKIVRTITPGLNAYSPNNKDGFITQRDINTIYSQDIYSLRSNPSETLRINNIGEPTSADHTESIKSIKNELKAVYDLIKEFFDADIQMVVKSRGLSDLYKNWLKYWTNTNSWDKQPLNKTGGLMYNNKKYEFYSSGGLINYYLIGFNTRMSEIQKSLTESDKNNPESGSNISSVKTATDLKRSLYQTFKNINDKWVIDEPNGGKNYYSWSLEGDVDPNNENKLKYNSRESLFEHFFFVDRINRDIGGELLLDFRVLNSYYEKVNSKNSLYSIIGELAKMNEMIFHPLTSYISFNGATSDKAPIDNLFKPITTLDFQSTSPVFIMQYVGKNSSYQYENQNHLPDVVKIDFSGEGRFTSPPNSPFKNNPDRKKINEPVAFFVDMGIKNQNMFRGISLDQAEFRETNESITVWDQLTSQKENRTVQTIGNNIYPILSRRSYTCKVESLGNMMIQPTMYFYLRYIPLFSGLYLITKVSHSIQPNNVVTNFEGVRMSSLNFPLVSEFISTLTKEIVEKGVNNVLATVTPNNNYYTNLSDVAKVNANTIYNTLKNLGYTSIEMIAGIMAVASKESGLKPVREDTYTRKINGDGSIKSIFGDNNNFTTEILPNGDEAIKFMAVNPRRYYNKLYYKQNGNLGKTNNPVYYPDDKNKLITFDDSYEGDGFKYRGGGFNQITGRVIYKQYGLEDTPDKITDPDTAARVLGEYNIKTLSSLRDKDKYSNMSGKKGLDALNSFTDLTDAYNVAYNLTAGPGWTLQKAIQKYENGKSYRRGLANLQSIYDSIKDGKIK